MQVVSIKPIHAGKYFDDSSIDWDINSQIRNLGYLNNEDFSKQQGIKLLDFFKISPFEEILILKIDSNRKIEFTPIIFQDLCQRIIVTKTNSNLEESHLILEGIKKGPNETYIDKIEYLNSDEFYVDYKIINVQNWKPSELRVEYSESIDFKIKKEVKVVSSDANFLKIKFDKSSFENWNSYFLRIKLSHKNLVSKNSFNVKIQNLQFTQNRKMQEQIKIDCALIVASILLFYVFNGLRNNPDLSDYFFNYYKYVDKESFLGNLVVKIMEKIVLTLTFFPAAGDLIFKFFKS